jgi:hypothetical protein
MWEQITRADMDRAKHRIAIQRRVMLKKHAEQLQALEAEGSEIEALERMVAAFATSTSPHRRPELTIHDPSRRSRQPLKAVSRQSVSNPRSRSHHRRSRCSIKHHRIPACPFERCSTDSVSIAALITRLHPSA